MTTPQYIVDRYLRGGCLAFAIAARRELGLPIHVLVDSHGDREDWVHAFVVDAERGVAIDVRGEMTLDARIVASGAGVSGDLSIVRATAKEAAARIAGWPTRGEISEARNALVRWVHPSLTNSVVPARSMP